MSRFLAKGAQFFVDLFLLSVAFWFAFVFRFEFMLDLGQLKLAFFTWPYVVVFEYLLLSIFGVPKLAWRYIGLRDMTRVLGALAVSTLVLVLLRLTLVYVGGYAKFVILPLGVLAMNFVLAFLFVTGVRVLRRILAERQERAAVKGVTAQKKRTLLIGAGRAGVMVAKEVEQNPALGMDVVGFVDDDPVKRGTIIQGLRVLGDTGALEKIAKDHEVDQAVITIAAASGSVIRRIVSRCEEISLPVKIIPGIYEILGGRVNLSRIREVTIDDLLGREAVDLDLEAIGRFLTGKAVMITGAGGSIGSELCRQVARFAPAKILLVERSENALFHIHRELIRTDPDVEAVPCIADVCDWGRVDALFAEHRPQVVFHAAAHKHVPMMEWNPGEAVKNNVFGTAKVAADADAHGAEAFVMISTDKAVNPTSIMGTSKRVAELYVQALSRTSKTKFVAVRFGNVLGSAGSVIPIFKEQIEKGGPVTVTHPEMRRYFMTIPEACQLVMQSAAMGEGGEIFVLDMGEPVFIRDLAADLIRLSGFTEEEIPIEYTGLRPGEKLFEELSTEGENMARTRHPKIFIGKIDSFPLDEVKAGLEGLSRVMESTDQDEVRGALRALVPEMREPDTD